MHNEGEVFVSSLVNGIVQLRPAMKDALELAEYLMIGDNIGDPGNEKNSLVLHQWYPLGGLKDSHADKLRGGAVRLKVKIILKDVMKGGALKEFVPYKDMNTILRRVSSSFMKMKLELKKLSIERDDELHKIRILEMNEDIRKRNELRKSNNFSGDDLDMYGAAMEHEILSSYELGRESRKKQLHREIVELEKQIERAALVHKRMEDILYLDQIAIRKKYVDPKYYDEKLGISAGINVAVEATGKSIHNLGVSLHELGISTGRKIHDLIDRNLFGGSPNINNSNTTNYTAK